MERKISINIGDFQRTMGEIESLKFAKSIGADGVDFDLCSSKYNYKNPESIYSKSI